LLVIIFVLSISPTLLVRRQLIGQVSATAHFLWLQRGQQPATTDQNRLLIDNIPARNQGPSFLSVIYGIRLTEI